MNGFDANQVDYYRVAHHSEGIGDVSGMATSPVWMARGGSLFSSPIVNSLGSRFVQANAPGFLRYRFTMASA
jgi:hypothetical protein